MGNGQGDQELAGVGEFLGGVLQGPDFPGAGFRLVDVGADLDQLLPAINMAGKKIYLVAVGGADIGHIGALTDQFQKDRGFQGVAEVGLAGSVKYRDQAGIDGVKT